MAATRPTADFGSPFVGFDESVNNPTLSAAVLALLERGLLSGMFTLWNRRRERTDGSIHYVWGDGIQRPDEKDVRGARGRWPDEWIVSGMMGHLLDHDRLILLSADRRLDNPDDLRSILQTVVDPFLAQHHAGRFSLIALFKNGLGTWEQFAAQVTQFVGAGRFVPGYSEVLF